MQEQEEQKQSTQTTTVIPSDYPKGAIITVLVIMGLCFLMALGGTILGAINFVSPTHYPTWILAIWLVGNILISLVMAVHAILYATYGFSSHDNPLMGIGGCVFGFVLLIGATTMLTERHFGWFSAVALFVLVGLTVIDLWLADQM